MLSNLVISRVDLVKAGSNSEAYIKLFKSKGGNDVMPTFEEVLASMKEEHQNVVKNRMEEVEKKKDEAEQKLKAYEENKKPMKKEEEETTKDILKNADPAILALFKSLEGKAAASEAIVKKMQEQQIETEAISLAKSMPQLPEAEETLIRLFKSTHGTPQHDMIVKILKKAANLVGNSNVFEQRGNDQDTTIGNADAIWALIEKEATELRKVRPELTNAAAITEVTKSRPELYSQYIQAQ